MDSTHQVYCIDCGQRLFLYEYQYPVYLKPDFKVKGLVCHNCYHDAYFPCDDCKNNYPNDHFYSAPCDNESDEKYVCEFCLKNNYFECCDCEEFFNKKYKHNISGDKFACDYCYSENGEYLEKETNYTIVDLQQGTKEWLEWRSQGIGASDAPAIMGENPWKSADYLLREKCGGMNRNFKNAAMARGIALEPEARKSYETKVGILVNPACLQNVEHEWQRASVDGLAVDGSVVVEIKCGERVYRKTSTSGAVPHYYYGQLQHILSVTGLSAIDFYCYLPGRAEVHLSVPRDNLYIKRLLDAEYLFWLKIIKNRR